MLKLKLSNKNWKTISIYFFYLLHHLLSLCILGFIIWSIIKIHNHFSKDNVSIINKNSLPTNTNNNNTNNTNNNTKSIMKTNTKNIKESNDKNKQHQNDDNDNDKKLN